MGNENSSPVSKLQRQSKCRQSPKQSRKLRELTDRQGSTESTGSNSSGSTQPSQTTPALGAVRWRTFPQSENSQRESYSKTFRKCKAVRQISREPLTENNLSSGLLTPRAYVPGKENRRFSADRRRSKSLCSQQLKQDCLVVSASLDGAQGSVSPNSGRRASNGVVQTLIRLRIQQCFKMAKPIMGHMILRKACSMRGEMRTFIARLPIEKVDYLAAELYSFISDCVDNTDDADRVKTISRSFGESLASLSPDGFRPDYLTPLADAAVAECVKLDGGAHKRCETLSAWSQLMAVMFTSVRDGFYDRVRRERRISLPHFQAKINISVEGMAKLSAC